MSFPNPTRRPYWPLALALLLGAGCGAEQTTALDGPALALSPAALTFSMVPVGATRARTVAMRNRSDAPLRIIRVTPSGDDAFTFELERSDIPAGGEAELEVQFAPTAIRAVTGALLIETDGGEAITLPLTGSGLDDRLPKVCEMPGELSFGNVVIGSTKVLEFPVCNESEVELHFEVVEGQNLKRCTSGAADPSVFCVELDGPRIGVDGRFSLAPGASVTARVRFSPVIAGTRERGGFTLRSCDNSACEHEVRLDGLGIEAGLRCDGALEFGLISPGACVTGPVVCENVANLDVEVRGWRVEARSPQPTPFSAAPSSASVVREGESVEIPIEYCPGEIRVGDDNAILWVETDQPAPDDEVRVELRGTAGGPEPSVAPEVVDFGTVALIAPARRTVLVSNLGFADLEIQDVLVDAEATGAFMAPGAAPAVVPPGGTWSVVVEFQPLAEGPIESSIVLRTNDGDRPEIVIPLRGVGVALPACRYEISPPTVNFGPLTMEHRARRGVEVRNVGTTDCLITGAASVPGSDAAFALFTEGLASQIIAPGEAKVVEVDFTPRVPGPRTGGIELSLSSPTAPFARIDMTGRGATDGLLLAPRYLDFGGLGVGCVSPRRAVRVHNPTRQARTITSIEVVGGPNRPFRLATLPTLPILLLAGEALAFEVELRVDGASEVADAVRVVGTADGAPIERYVGLRATPVATGAPHVERFVQPAAPVVDVLFVIDQSCSLGQEHAGLVANFAALRAALGADFHLGVTTADNDDERGRLVYPNTRRGDPFGGDPANRIITPQSTPSPDARFDIAIQARPMSGGGAIDEAGLWATFQALEPGALQGNNAGFIRPDAALSVVYLSDEPEQSQVRAGAPSESVEFYVDYLRSLKGPEGHHRVSASAIVGDDPGGCQGAGGAAAAAPRYVEIARRTGGEFGSICSSDYGRMLSDLAFPLSGRRSTFFLQNRPIVDSLSVRFGATPVPPTSAGGAVRWRYEASDNTLRFMPASVPPDDTEVFVTYRSECL